MTNQDHSSPPDPAAKVSRSISDADTVIGPPAEGGGGALREGPGTKLGPYKILQLIGEGGFGSVFLAQQDEPVQRKVALKIIKLGMDTRQVVARFEQERQALALMDHPNIAKVLDAGATETGRPFFVMELVKGDPIVEYCDRNKLSIDERLEVFAQVCTAVQHAHTKGIIHRDIKPSNVLVSTQDGRPTCKVIDFGIAKATSARLTEKTLFTDHHQLIGTPEYMSPEQAEGSIDIDTRTDVYSLGVLLYELLTGTTPFSGGELRSAAYAEIQRIIREVEPPIPSTRLSRNTDTIAGIAARRHTEPRKLGTIIRGDLDWIVMKAMEKDRQRRYETANGLAMDIRRFLRGEAVVAAPPSKAYRMKKFIGRNRGAVTASAAIAAALLVGVVAFAWQTQVARRERDRAVAAETQIKKRADELQKVSDFQASMLSQIDATQAGEQLLADVKDRFAKSLAKSEVPQEQRASRSNLLAKELGEVNATDTAAAMIDRTILKPSIKAIDEKFKDQPAIDAALRHTIADLYRTLGLYQEALPLIQRAVDTRRRVLGEDDPKTIASLNVLADTYLSTGKTDEAAALFQDTLERSKRVLGLDNEETLALMGNLGNVLRDQGKFTEAEPLLRGAMEGRRRVLGNEHRETLISLNTYGYLLIAQGKAAEAEPYWREAYETGKRVFGPDNSDTLVWTANVGGLMLELGRLEDATNLYREAAEGFRRVRGEEHPYTLACLSALCQTLTKQGKLNESEKIFVEVLEAQRRSLGEDHPDTMNTTIKLGRNLADQGRLTEAEAVMRSSVATSRRVLGNDNAMTLDRIGCLADTLARMERYEESNALYLEQIPALERVLGKNHPAYLVNTAQFGDSLIFQGKLEQAEPYLRTAVEARRKISGKAHPETGFALNSLGALLREQGKLAEAEAAIRESLQIFRAALNKDNPSTFAEVSILAEVLLVQNKLDEAEPLCIESVEGLQRVSGKDSIRTAAARRTFGRLLVAQKKFEQAETELLESQRVLSAQPGASRRSRRQTIQAISELYSAWNAADPGKGHEAQATEWNAKLKAITAPTEPDGHR